MTGMKNNITMKRKRDSHFVIMSITLSSNDETYM